MEGSQLRVIKNVPGSFQIAFGWGSFDAWCVFLTRLSAKTYAPKDTEYFTLLQQLAIIHGAAKMYNDFLSFYHPTTATLNETILETITTLSQEYQPNAEEINLWFTVLYAGMVAEENKTHAILKKRIKRLGLHQVLLEGMNPMEAANFSKGKKWQELDKLMLAKGF